MKDLMTRLNAREKYGTTFLPVAMRRIKSIDFANAYRGAPDGVEKQYFSFTFTYELAKIASEFPTIDTLFKGKATLVLSPEDGEWHLTKADLSDLGEDRHKVFALREPYVDHMGQAIEAHYAKYASQYSEIAKSAPSGQPSRDPPAGASPTATSLQSVATAPGGRVETVTRFQGTKSKLGWYLELRPDGTFVWLREECTQTKDGGAVVPCIPGRVVVWNFLMPVSHHWRGTYEIRDDTLTCTVSQPGQQADGHAWVSTIGNDRVVEGDGTVWQRR
jgi:hypothetical protein